MFTLLTMYALADSCERTFSDQEARGLAALAEEAFANVDADGFRSARAKLSVAVTCLDEPASPTSVARYFLVEGLGAHLAGTPEVARSDLAAYAELEPLPPPTTVAPEGHPLRIAWQAAVDGGPSPRHPLAVPAKGRIWIDGRETLELPDARPSIVQFIVDGAVDWTEVVPAGGSPRSYPSAPESSREAYSTGVDPRVPDRTHRVVLPVIAGTLIASGIGTWAASAGTQARFKKLPREDRDGIAGAKQLTNALTLTSVGLFVGGTGVAAAAVFTW